MDNKKYWQSFAELNDPENFHKLHKDEFQEELPFEDGSGKGWLDEKAPRRDFLKYLGFSTAAATLAASCEVPVRKAVPLANKPENYMPGVAKYYATTFVQDGEVVPIIAKVRDGRPIKIEGNTLSSITRGGTSPRVQASVLDLYDTHRNRHAKRRNGNKFEEVPTFEQLDTMVANAMAGLGGAPVVLLTGTIVSPSTRQVIAQFLAKYPGSRHVQYDAVSYSGMLMANQASFGRRAIPSYQFDRARVVVSLGADFLGTWLNPVEFARQYSTGRKINEKNPVMSKHYQLESFLSMTGANADERFVHRPSETGMVAMAILNALGGAAPAVNIADAALKAGIQKIARDLQANRGAALVVSGSNDPNVQQVVNAINSAIGAYGSTIDWGAPLLTKQGSDADLVNLVNQMNAGQVGALLIYGANPAYDYHNPQAFINGLKKVRLSISMNEKMDETTELCNYSVPAHHFLESWGDAEIKPGFISLMQPTIHPLFKTRAFQDSLLKWSGNNTTWDVFFRQYWSGQLGGTIGFEKALQDGVVERGGAASAALTEPTRANQNTTDTTETGAAPAPAAPAGFSGGAYSGAGLGAAVQQLTAGRKGGKTEVVLYQNVAMASGKQSGNPWLLELPDPVTKITWDNYAMISTAKARELSIDYQSTDYEYYPQKPVIKITANNKEISIPAVVVPGMHPDTIAIALGYGRNEAYGKASKNVGQNLFQFARFNGATVDYYNDATLAERPEGEHKLAITQVHGSYENRFEVVRETTMGTFLKYPNEVKEWREELHKDYAPKTGDFRKEATLYGDHVQPGPKWGMSIDMNSCIGCGACVVACHAENNVPVVGKKEVMRYHDMHWLRIDRYFVSDEKNPDNLKAVVFQPMLCQHCDNAPCENVCPVAATPHSAEGINMMAYNRCVGTRYCANNCPYKVRRFNWADYTGSDSFSDNQKPLVANGTLDEVVLEMNDDLTRMVLNPDVTVRSRGVMEKCSFCIQRVQEGKLKAKVENRPLLDSDVNSACAQACPTNAIVFGNANDKASRVTQMREQNPQRLFYVIEQIHTLPNVNYLMKVRNTEEVVMKEGGEAEHGGQSLDSKEPSGDKVTPHATEGAH